MLINVDLLKLLSFLIVKKQLENLLASKTRTLRGETHFPILSFIALLFRRVTFYFSIIIFKKHLLDFMGDNTVFVGSLPDQTKEEDLENFFNKFGRIVDIRTPPKQVAKPRIAFITFSNSAEAQRALARGDQQNFLNKRMVVSVIRSKRREIVNDYQLEIIKKNKCKRSKMAPGIKQFLLDLDRNRCPQALFLSKFFCKLTFQEN
jgi:hypothetical protein